MITSSDPRYTPLDFCFNEELFNKFLFYFKSKCKEIIKAIEKEPILLPEDRFKNLETAELDQNSLHQDTLHAFMVV
ncbi:MAG: hypothetical protein HQK53_11125 [Oligoflexia bacterium]|nr:hypothetical protein [Oligoflexia bacterium]